MPLPMVHLLVANGLKCDKINKTPEYFLGVIAPDAVHMRKDYKREHKTASHFGIKNVGGTEKIEELYEKIRSAKETERKNFLLGCLTHILTDKLWLDTLYGNIYLKNYENDPLRPENEREAYYNDTDQIDYMLYENMPWREEIFDKIEKAKVFGIENVLRCENVYMWRIRTVNWFSKESEHKNPLRYIKYSDVLEFADFASKKINKIIGTLQLT